MHSRKFLLLLPLLAWFFVSFASNASALELPNILPGSVDGISNHFEITNSKYLNISIDSSEIINARVESVPHMILMHIEPSATAISSAVITIGNLEPNTTYYWHQDTHRSMTPFITDSIGSYSYTQDLTSSHLIFIKPEPSTKYISDNATGGDCATIGNWNVSAKTCTLTTNLTETVEISSNGITLDGNGHSITKLGTVTGYGVFINSKGNISIKNLNISGFSTGILVYGAPVVYNSGNILTNNNTFNNNIGIDISGSIDNMITNNTSNSNNAGIVINDSYGNTLRNNVMSNNLNANFNLDGYFNLHDRYYFNNDIDTSNLVNGKPIYYIKNASNAIYDSSTNAGIFYCISCDNITVKDLEFDQNARGIVFYNTINSRIENVLTSNNQTGISLVQSRDNSLINNSISQNYIGIRFYSSGYNLIFNNNFTSNEYQLSLQYSGDNTFNSSLPLGGNYWDDYDEVAEGCRDFNLDKICDNPYVLDDNQQDNYPWTVQNAWPPMPTLSSQNQYKLDGSTTISEGITINQAGGIFKANLTDPDNNQVKLEVELKKFNEGFNGTGTSLSSLVNSGSDATVAISNLSNGGYHWRARALSSNGNQSGWQEFGIAGNIDFNVNFINPVIIVPGILGSWWRENLPNLNQVDFVMDPILDTYDPLINAFVGRGYLLNEDLFTFPYDWRLDNRLTAVKLKDKIAEAKETCGCNKVNVVAHSMGGLVARYYIESNLYQNDIDNLILLGTPNNGSPKAYLMWEAGELTPGIFGKKEDFVTEKLLGILAYAEGFGLDNFRYIHEKPILSVKQLLPTYDYLRNDETSALLNYPAGYPENPFLSNSDSLGGLNSPSGLQKLSDSGVKITNIFSNQSNGTINTIRIVNPSPFPILWQDGYPDGYGALSGDHGLELGNGDGTVPVTSASSLNTSNTQQIELDESHGDLPTAAWPDVFETLTGIRPAPVYQPPGLSLKNYLIVSVHSPIDIQIIDPLGRKIGKNFEINEVFNEIPLAYYPGFNNPEMEFVVIQNPIDGEYQILTKGTDSGSYRIQTDYISDQTSKEASFTANTIDDLNEPLTFNLASSSPENIVIIPKDQIPPTTSINISGVQTSSRWYFSNVLISLNVTDDTNGVGVFKTEYSLDNGTTWQNYTVPFSPPDGFTVKIVYRSQDYVGNIETIKTSAVFKIDQTPPEAKLYFDTANRYLKVEGADNVSNTAVKRIDAKNYTITDEAGHTLKINLDITNGRPIQAATSIGLTTEKTSVLNTRILGLQYDSNTPIIPYTQNNLGYEWSSPSNNSKAYALFNQSLILENSNVVGNYDYAQNKTTIERTQKSKTTKYEFPGMRVIKLTTSKGQLGVEY